jgi:hypothetical protein
VVCDVSGKNPNVMFELGIRLAFDKPTIIVKDEKTSYSFDTAPIEHLEYPRDLRYADIVAFKDELARKILSTHKKATEDPNYTTFLKHFGTFTVPKLDTKEVDKEEFILDELKSLRQLVTNQLGSGSVRPPLHHGSNKEGGLCLRQVTESEANELSTSLAGKFGNSAVRLRPMSKNHFHIDFPRNKTTEDQRQEIVDFAAQKVPSARWLIPGMGASILPRKTGAS